MQLENNWVRFGESPKWFRLLIKTCQKIGVLIVGITPIQMENVTAQRVVMITKNQYFIQIYKKLYKVILNHKNDLRHLTKLYSCCCYHIDKPRGVNRT